MNQQDKRVIRTRSALTAALISLTIEKGYEAVTIQEITGRAGVGYRTYFRHYADKDALLYDVLETTVMELRPLIGTPVAVGGGKDGCQPLPPENGRIIFEHIAANKDLYRVLLGSGDAALEPLKKYGYREALNSLEMVPHPPVPPPILAEHIVTTTFAMAQWWLENDMPYSPREMAVYLARLVAVPGD